MLERLSWKKLILEWVFFCLPAVFLSFFIGHLTLLLLFSMMATLLWNYYNQLKLSHWLWLDRRIMPPSGSGSWEPLFYGLSKLQQRNRKRRKELTKLIKRFRRGAESLPDAVILCTETGHVSWCNRLAQHVLGFRWPEDNGQHLFNLIRYPQFSEYVQRKKFKEPLTLMLNNGRNIEFRLMPYLKGQILIVARDITKISQLEESRRQFLANVSHELRTPLTVIKGYLEVFSDQRLEAEQMTNAVHMMQLQTDRMDNLVNQLLVLSRIESAPHIDLIDIVNVPNLLLRLQNEIKSQFGDEKHPINFDVDHDLSVYGNEGLLYSIMSNLIYNAIYHTANNATIDVCWKSTSFGAEFSVKDTGEGIAAEHLNHLTERFYRVDKARSRHTGGTGLGLAIVKHALIHHHSKLDIQSVLGQGSCFSFILSKELCVTS